MSASPEPARILITKADKLLASCADRKAALADLDALVARGAIQAWVTGVTSLHRKTDGSSQQPSGRVQPATWATIRNSAHDAEMWTKGAVKIEPTLTSTGVSLSGIRLERDPFMRLIDEHAPLERTAPPVEPATVPAPSIAGPSEDEAPGGKTQWRKWDKVWGAIVTLAIEEKLNQADMPSKTALMEAVRDKLKTEGFSDTTLKPFICRVYKRFVEPNAR